MYIKDWSGVVPYVQTKIYRIFFLSVIHSLLEETFLDSFYNP